MTTRTYIINETDIEACRWKVPVPVDLSKHVCLFSILQQVFHVFSRELHLVPNETFPDFIILLSNSDNLGQIDRNHSLRTHKTHKDRTVDHYLPGSELFFVGEKFQ